MTFARRMITKTLDLINLQRHNDNYADIQDELIDQDDRIIGAQSDITTHKASTAAHPAEHVTYEGEVIGADNIKEGLDIIKTELDQAIISGDSGPEAAASRYNPFTGVTHATLPDRLNEEWEQTATQLADVATITSSSYGITGDGTDETAKVVAMMAAIPANGATIVFDKSKEITVNGTSLINISNKHNVVIEGLKIIGTSAAVFQITDGSSNITFRDCYFEDVGQAIYLFTCSEITVDNCVFNHTGYGVIQRLGFVSNNVKVINCTAMNMKNDFVEANCTSSAPSKNWSVINCHYLGGADYPTEKIEQRFVGITGVHNVIISQNIVERVSGDSAVHLEDVGGNILIDHNIFDNVVGASYIALLHIEKTAIIDGNYFLRTDTSLAIGSVLLPSTILATPIKFNNNVVRGVAQNLNGLNLGSRSNWSCVGNTFEYLNKAISVNDSYDILIASNDFAYNNYDISANIGVGQVKTEDIHVIGNKFKHTITKCIEVKRNTSGTALSASSRWLIEGNTFSNDVTGDDTIDCTCIGNVVASGKIIDFGRTFYIGSTGYVAANNRIIGINALIGAFERIFYGTAAPTTGTYIKNDKTINTNSTAGGYEGWVCVTAGTPGVHKGYGAIQA